MKLVLMEYLASLKERGELDVIMPDLLSELGMTVISRPAIGTKQYGVDVAAVGDDSDGVRRLFLLSIKAGDLKRSGWDGREQSLRKSLNQIIDVYIQKHIPKRYASLPIRVVLCLGGELHEAVKDDVNGFMDRHTDDRVTFDIWNGDGLADRLLSGVLREHALPQGWRSDFRKFLAMVDEPDISFGYFCRFAASIADAAKPTRPACLTAIRQIYLGLWTLYVWARMANNIEAAYLSSERAVLISWSLIKNQLSGKSKAARQINRSMKRVITLHNMISENYLTSYVKPRTNLLHGLASAVPSQSSLDINLRLFDILGRIGSRGLWLLHAVHCLDLKEREDDAGIARETLYKTATLLSNTIQNNPILCTPIQDNQAIDINIACLFLNRVGYDRVIQKWIHQIVRATIFAYHSNGPYPCVFRDYRDLIDHPKKDAKYRIEATAASLLVPTLAVWAAITDDTDTLRLLQEFTSNTYEHATLQLWYPGSNTEDHLYCGTANHGLTQIDIKIERSCRQMLATVNTECEASGAFYSLSPINYGLWPIFISASRHHRVPVPPHLWPFVN